MCTFCFLLCLMFLCLSPWPSTPCLAWSTPFCAAGAGPPSPAFFFLLRDPVPPPLTMIVGLLYNIYKGLQQDIVNKGSPYRDKIGRGIWRGMDNRRHVLTNVMVASSALLTWYESFAQ